jgi:hypothetical protein
MSDRAGSNVEPAGGAARRGQGGSALVLVLLVLAVLLLIGSAFLSASLSERSIAVNETNSGKAFNIAEAGIEHSRALLPDTDVDALLTAGGKLFNGQSLDQGSYTVDVTNNIGPTYPRGAVPVDPGGATVDTDRYLVLSSTGNFRTAERTIDVVIERELVPFPYGLFGRNLLRLGGTGVAQTDVGSNADIEFTGVSPAVLGDAAAGGTVTDPSYVTGTSTDGADPQEFPEIRCPSTPFGGVPAGAGVNFDAGTGDIGLSGGTDKTFAGGTYYYRDFKKAGVGKLVIPLGHRVNIYISRELDVQGSGFVNLNGSAEFLQIWACGNDTTNWAFAGSDEVWLTLYAPHHDLTMTGSGDKHGSFVGNVLRTGGAADYYYDLGLTLPTGRYLIVPGTWVDSGL